MKIHNYTLEASGILKHRHCGTDLTAGPPYGRVAHGSCAQHPTGRRWVSDHIYVQPWSWNVRNVEPQAVLLQSFRLGSGYQTWIRVGRARRADPARARRRGGR
jgi:hypothetical protein